MITDATIDYVIALSLEAGQEIMLYYDNMGVTVKEDNSPLTKADIASHNTIMEGLEKFSYPIISEESKEHDIIEKDEEFYWLVDPLDGTKEFINKSNEFTTNIALIHNNKPIFGVVYAPAMQKFWVGQNYGKKFAFTIDNTFTRKEITCRKADMSKLVSFVSKNHANSERLENFYKINELNIAEEVSAGSSLKICKIAEGDADIYPRLGTTMEWDIAAAQAVLEAAGGFVYSSKSGTLIYGKKDLKNEHFIATNFQNNFRF